MQPLQNFLQGVVGWMAELVKSVNGANPVVQAFVATLATAFAGLLLVAVTNTIGAFLRFSGIVVSLGAPVRALGIMLGGLAAGTLTLSRATTLAGLAFGGLPGIILTVISVAAGLATGFGLLDDKLDGFAKASEEAATKQQDFQDKLASGQSVMTSLQEAINRLIDRYDVLGASGSALKSEMYALSSQFGALGLNIDLAADSADTLITKLIQLQAAQAGYNAVNATGIALEANNLINAEGGTFAANQGNIFDQLNKYQSRLNQSGSGFTNPNAKESQSRLNDLQSIFNDLGIGDTSELTQQNISDKLLNRGIRDRIKKARDAASAIGDQAALDILAQLDGQILSLTKIQGQQVTREQADRAVKENETIRRTSESPGYAAAIKKYQELRGKSKEIQAEIQKRTDPLEANDYFQGRREELEKMLSELEGQATALGDDFLNAPGVTLRSDIAALKNEIRTITGDVTEKAGKQVVAEAKQEVDLVGKELAIAIEQQRRGSGVGRMARPDFVKTAENLSTRQTEQALADSGLKAMIDAGQIGQDLKPIAGKKVPRNYAVALREFRVAELRSIADMQDRINDYDAATETLNKRNKAAGGSKKTESLLFTRLATLRKRLVDGTQPEVVASTQQEAIDLIENMLGVSLTALKDRLAKDPTSFIQESDFGNLDEMTKAKLVAFFDQVRKNINVSLEELLRQQGEATRSAALAEVQKRKLLSQGYDEAARIAASQATASDNAGLPGVFADSANARAKRANETAFRFAEGSLTKDRVTLLTTQTQELTAWLEQANVQMAALEARRSEGDFTVETQITELRKQQADATENLTTKTEALDAAKAQLTATELALAQAEIMRNGSLADAAQLTVDAWMQANAANESINETLSETITAGLNAASSGFASFFKDVATGAKSAGEAFQDLAMTILDAMLDVIASELAKQFLELIIGSFSGGGIIPSQGGASASRGPGAMQGTIVRAAQGFTPPIATRDSVLIRAQPGEAILRSSAVSMIGEEGIRQMNALGNRKISRAAQGVRMPEPQRMQPSETNVYVVSKDRVPTLGPKDVIATISDNIETGGSIKQLIKRVQSGM